MSEHRPQTSRDGWRARVDCSCGWRGDRWPTYGEATAAWLDHYREAHSVTDCTVSSGWAPPAPRPDAPAALAPPRDAAGASPAGRARGALPTGARRPLTAGASTGTHAPAP